MKRRKRKKLTSVKDELMVVAFLALLAIVLIQFSLFFERHLNIVKYELVVIQAVDSDFVYRTIQKRRQVVVV